MKAMKKLLVLVIPLMMLLSIKVPKTKLSSYRKILKKKGVGSKAKIKK